MNDIEQFLVAEDDALSAITGGFANEPISARCWRCRAKQPFKTLRPIIDFFALHLFSDPDHCQGNYANHSCCSLGAHACYASPASELTDKFRGQS